MVRRSTNSIRNGQAGEVSQTEEWAKRFRSVGNENTGSLIVLRAELSLHAITRDNASVDSFIDSRHTLSIFVDCDVEALVDGDRTLPSTHFPQSGTVSINSE